MDINNKRISATPRSKYTSYAGIGNYTSNSSSGNFNSSNYLKLSGEETQTVEGDVAFTGDVIAYTDNPEAGDVTLPIASENTLGCVKVGEGLNVDGYGVITIDPYYVGSGGSGNIPDWVTDTKPNVSYFTNDANYLKSTDNITANKLGTTTIGNTAKGIYLDNGTPMPLSATVGSASIPVYINGGLPTVCTSINLNAASATKLLNSRSLWGQTFNGEKNISGNMTGVGSLTATGDITTTTNMKANGDIVAYSTGSSTLSLPIASTGALGTIKVGTNLSITSAGVLSSKDTIFTGGTITSAIVRGEGTFLQSTAGTSFTLTNDYTDVKFNVTDSGDRHFQFWRGTTRLCQLGISQNYSHLAWYTGSDMRLKEKISNIDGILNKIDNASVFSYKRKDLGTDNIYVGVSAQEWLEICPNVVTLNDDGYYSVDYSAIGAIAIQGCKELKAENDSLKKEIAELKQYVQSLESTSQQTAIDDLLNRMQALEKLCL